MPKHLQRDVERLKKMFLSLSAMVEEQLRRAVISVSERNTDLAETVIETDQSIDRMEIDVEEECLKILALHQPVANDLRYIVAILKINGDLERIGDLAVNIAERTLLLARHERIDVPYDFSGMAAKVQNMLKRCLDGLVNLDPQLCRTVLTDDDEVDNMNREMYDQVEEEILAHTTPDHLDSCINLLSVSRNLERIADHATNIAEDVIYLVEGDIIRHRQGLKLVE